MSTFKLGVVLGRFQHIHNGHTTMIDTALDACDKVLLLVGSSQESGTVRNPFTLYTRMNLIREVYSSEIRSGELLLGHIDDLTDETDHSTDWGEFVLSKIEMWSNHYGIQKEFDCIISGVEEDRISWFAPEKAKRIGQILIPKSIMDVSATGVRTLIADKDYYGWKSNTPFEDRKLFDELREELLKIDFYKGAPINEQDYDIVWQ